MTRPDERARRYLNDRTLLALLARMRNVKHPVRRPRFHRPRASQAGHVEVSRGPDANAVVIGPVVRLIFASNAYMEHQSQLRRLDGTIPFAAVGAMPQPQSGNLINSAVAIHATIGAVITILDTEYQPIHVDMPTAESELRARMKLEALGYFLEVAGAGENRAVTAFQIASGSNGPDGILGGSTTSDVNREYDALVRNNPP